MIKGTGIDIIEVKRIENAIEKWGEDFLKHIFNEEEIAYAKKNKYPCQHYAARFAAKEAVYKAIGNDPNIHWKDIKVLNDNHGKPYCELKKPGFTDKINISLSHTKNYAVANAIISS